MVKSKEKKSKKSGNEKKIKKDFSLYSIDEAIKKVKENAKEKFDASVEAHINLKRDPKVEMYVRFTTTLPHGTGQTKKVAVFASKKVAEADLELSESDLKKIEKGEIKPKVDFDVLIAEPKFMSKIAVVAKILGPAGLMPNPKTGTVSEDVEKTVKQFKKGRTEIKTEKDLPVIHTVIGKLSMTDQQLKENLTELMAALKSNKPSKAKQDWMDSVFICSSMGKSYMVNIFEE